MGAFASHVDRAMWHREAAPFDTRGQLWQLQMCGSAFPGCDFLLVPTELSTLQVPLPWPAGAATFNSAIQQWEVISSLPVLLLLCILYLKYLHEISACARVRLEAISFLTLPQQRSFGRDLTRGPVVKRASLQWRMLMHMPGHHNNTEDLERVAH